MDVITLKDRRRSQKKYFVLTFSLMAHIENYTRSVIIRGSLYSYPNMQAYLQRKKIDLTSEYQGQDITSLFYDTSTPCTGYPGLNPSNTQCIVQNPYSINASLIAKPCITFTDLQVSGPRPTAKLSFLWTDFQDRSRRDLDNIIIYDGRSKRFARSRARVWSSIG